MVADRAVEPGHFGLSGETMALVKQGGFVSEVLAADSPKAWECPSLLQVRQSECQKAGVPMGDPGAGQTCPLRHSWTFRLLGALSGPLAPHLAARPGADQGLPESAATCFSNISSAAQITPQSNGFK